MFVSRVFSRVSRSSLNHCGGISSSRNQLPQIFSNTSSDSLLVSGQSMNKWVPCKVNAMHNMFTTTVSQQFWYSSSASPQSNEKENSQEINNTFSKAKAETKVDDDAKSAEDTSESDTETDLSVEDLDKILAEREEFLEFLTKKEEFHVVNLKEIEKREDEVLRTYAEMNNVIDQRNRQVDSLKKSVIHAIQSLAKGLLDVADNLGRASSVAKDSFAKIDSSKDTAGAVPVLKTLLEGVEMTEKQVAKWVPRQVNAMHNMFTTTAGQQFWYSSSAAPQSNEKENSQEINNTFSKAKAETKVDDDAKSAEDTSESDTETDLSVEDLAKFAAHKEEFLEVLAKTEELLVVKRKKIEKREDEVLRYCAEIKNLLDQRDRKMDILKKSAIQSFAKGLLDVADNLGRASSVAKDSFAKIDSSKDTAGAVPVLKTLLEGVEMTEKQVAEVFRKFGVEKFDPLNEQFDPDRHHALFQIPDSSKPSGIVDAVLKAGYTLYGRVIRPAEVGVTQSSDGETQQSKEE